MARETKEERIKRLAKEKGVKLDPALLAMLLQLAGPLIEMILERLKKRQK